MLAANQVETFHRNGFLNGGSVLSIAEVEKLRAEVDRVLAIGSKGFERRKRKPVLITNLVDSAEGSRIFWQIVNIWEASESFRRLLYHPFIVAAIARLANTDELTIWHDQLLYKPPRTGGVTCWHQDAPLWPIIRPMTPVSAWIALDDADVDNGCMWMTPGSHTWGNQIEFLRTQSHIRQVSEFGRLEGFTPPPGARIRTVTPVSCPVKCGEVSFHHSLTWHGAPVNFSDRPRRAIAIHYMTGDARFVASGHHVMKPYVSLQDGEPMSRAGSNFPRVMEAGKVMRIGDRQ
ncbi:MAG: phytanoyl-CoA dioxygenase family protein [candidate division Zixibacteria bacterium]|nr:phytanoyl-CoA dioxygenase family protein [candidate division Zixibacteria bacterium]